MSEASAAEDAFAAQLTAAGIPHTRQVKFAPDRKFRADFALPEHGLLVEVQGGGWNAGRHHRPSGYAADCVRMGKAVALGWTMLYLTPDQVASGEALEMVRAALSRPERPELPAVAPTRPKRSRKSVAGHTAASERAPAETRAAAEAIGPRAAQALREQWGG